MDEDAKIARSFDLPQAQARLIDTLVESGAFASSSDVVSAGLDALQLQTAAFERWLQDEVGPTYDRMRPDPSRGIPAAEVRERLRARSEGQDAGPP